MKVEIVSRENIRPSSTPPHPKTYTLSLLDQKSVSSFTPFLIFYSPRTEVKGTDMNRILKDSLSRVLTSFYPLAGRIRDHRSVDCNDQGVEYAEARVDCNISSLLEKPPSMEMLGQLLPDKLFATCNEDPFVLVQANLFLCGGMALAVKISHKVADGVSMDTFIKGWSNTALGFPRTVVPDWTASSRFPPVEGVKYSRAPMFDRALSLKGLTRRFVFEGSKISELKQKMANDQVKNPTRVEAVSCFLWKRILAVSKKAAPAPQGGTRRRSVTTALIGGVNIRASLVPPLPEYAMGNLVRPVCPMGDESEIEETGGLSLFRESVADARQHAGDGMESEVASLIKKRADAEMKSYLLGNLCRSSLYEADFGWGKPTWVSYVEMIATNCIGLLDTWDGRGIEVLVKLVEQEMVLLEQDKELLEFASLNPPIKALPDVVSSKL